jgi:hypothetical protein
MNVNKALIIAPFVILGLLLLGILSFLTYAAIKKHQRTELLLKFKNLDMNDLIKIKVFYPNDKNLSLSIVHKDKSLNCTGKIFEQKELCEFLRMALYLREDEWHNDKNNANGYSCNGCIYQYDVKKLEKILGKDQYKDDNNNQLKFYEEEWRNDKYNQVSDALTKYVKNFHAKLILEEKKSFPKFAFEILHYVFCCNKKSQIS